MLRRADEALYVAKRAGRNRAALWEPPTTETPSGLQLHGRHPRRHATADRN